MPDAGTVHLFSSPIDRSVVGNIWHVRGPKWSNSSHPEKAAAYKRPIAIRSGTVYTNQRQLTGLSFRGGKMRRDKSPSQRVADLRGSTAFRAAPKRTAEGRSRGRGRRSRLARGRRSGCHLAQERGRAVVAFRSPRRSRAARTNPPARTLEQLEQFNIR